MLKNHLKVPFTIISLFILVIILIPSTANAHKVSIFAYTEGDTVFTESYFNDGSPCLDSTIEVYDPQGNQLLKGKTDAKGTFSFKIPQKEDLKIVLVASMGHKTEYTLKGVENQHGEGTFSDTNQKGVMDKGADQDQRTDDGPKYSISDIEELKRVIDESVERSVENAIKPLMSAIAKKELRASISDVVGGIGYILGIIGIIFYFKKRNK